MAVDTSWIRDDYDAEWTSRQQLSLARFCFRNKILPSKKFVNKKGRKISFVHVLLNMAYITLSAF
jgi:hypothetical protein